MHNKIENTLFIENAVESGSVVMQIHPYIGFSARVANNLGFDSDVDYPYIKKNENEYIIGVFGGSVARFFVDYESKAHELENYLKEYFFNSSKVKKHDIKIKFLNFSFPLYKQPQQLLALNYALSVGQNFDCVINIDGFNEIMASAKNLEYGIETSAPSVMVSAELVSMANKEYSSDLALTAAIMDSRKKMRASQTEASECRLASCYAYMKAKEGYYQRVYADFINKKIGSQQEGGDKSSLVYLGKLNGNEKRAIKEEEYISIWKNSLVAMRQVLDARKIHFFSFIQPNQYYQTARVMSEEEKRVAILRNENSEFHTYVPSGYSRILAEASKLNAQGIKVYDATRIFDVYPQVIYADNCCHYNDAGNHILSEYIGKVMVDDFQEKTGIQ